MRAKVAKRLRKLAATIVPQPVKAYEGQLHNKSGVDADGKKVTYQSTQVKLKEYCTRAAYKKLKQQYRRQS